MAYILYTRVIFATARAVCQYRVSTSVVLMRHLNSAPSRRQVGAKSETQPLDHHQSYHHGFEDDFWNSVLTETPMTCTLPLDNF